MSSEHEPDDRELEDFLAGRDPIGKAYREAARDETAPRELDAAILSAARAAVGRPLRRRPRWLQPLAVAATLALSLGVLLNLWRDPALRPALSPQPRPEATREQQDRDPMPVPAAPVQAEPEPERVLRDSSVELKRPEARRKTQGMIDGDAPRAAPASPLDAPSARSEALAPAAPPTESTESDGAAKTAPEAEAQHQAPAASAGAMSRDDVAPLHKSEAAREALSGSAADAAQSELPAADWIRRIRDLRDQGAVEDARQELREFVRSHPDYRLPEDLMSLAAGIAR